MTLTTISQVAKISSEALSFILSLANITFLIDHFMADRWEKMEIVEDFIFWGSKITEDSDCSMKLKETSVQFSYSVVSDSATPLTAAHQASLSFNNPQTLLRFMSIELVMPSSHLILCHALFLLPSIFPSIRVFSMSQFFP